MTICFFLLHSVSNAEDLSVGILLSPGVLPFATLFCQIDQGIPVSVQPVAQFGVCGVGCHSLPNSCLCPQQALQVGATIKSPNLPHNGVFSRPPRCHHTVTTTTVGRPMLINIGFRQKSNLRLSFIRVFTHSTKVQMHCT